MLGILGEHSHNDRAKRLLIRFINVMADITTNLDPQEISTPIQRGLAALSKLNIQEARDLSDVNGNTVGKLDSDDVAAMITPSSSDLEERSPYSVLVCISITFFLASNSQLTFVSFRIISYGGHRTILFIMNFEDIGRRCESLGVSSNVHYP